MNSDKIVHSGTPHEGSIPHSGRYAYGSGENPYQRDNSFLGQYYYYKKSGAFANDTEIARAMGYSTTEFRNKRSQLVQEEKAAKKARAVELWNKQKDYGKPNISAIAREMGESERTVNSWLHDTRVTRAEKINNTANVLRAATSDDHYIDVGTGVENRLGISRVQLNAAIEKLKDEGYNVVNVYVEQVGTGQNTTIKTLVPPGVDWKEANKHYDRIKLVDNYSLDDGRTYLNIEPPVSVSSKRVAVAYDSPKDGLIELRPGIDDISLGNASYAQVRIAVDDTHYLKGMAVYNDKLSPGIDILVNSNKHPGTPLTAPNKDDPQVAKPLKKNKENPFGATIKNEEKLTLAQRHYIGADGKEHQSAINIVNEEGDIGKWSKTLSSQVLSKQPPALAKKQLAITASDQVLELEKIKALTNPVVKQKLLDSFADDCESKAVHLKAANLPRQASHFILPFNSVKENEVYAPNYDDGETVILIRYPHGGKFEIPTLTVNNKNREAKKTLGNNPPDAIGINPKVAGKLSGADFDGDTVLVIPVNNKVKIKTSNDPAFKELQTFDPKESYPKYPGMKVMSEDYKQKQMGIVTNLLNDMTLQGAKPEEIVGVVKHTMVVIDAAKHELNWRQSEQDNHIKELKAKYQTGGASTLISRAKSEQRVNERKELTNTSRMTPEQLADWNAGKKVYVETGKTYIDKKGKEHYRQMESTKMAETDDAFKLTSGGSKDNPGTKIEEIYAEHANTLKALAQEARRESRSIKGSSRDPEAVKTYATEVASLNAKLDTAMRNKPLERQAQVIANKTIQIQMRDNQDMSKDDKKRLKQQALAGARYKVGKDPYTIDITPDEWKAIQAGAVSKTTLSAILNNADMDQVKKYATPKRQKGLTPAEISMARNMAASGHPQSEIAKKLGVSTSTIANYV